MEPPPAPGTRLPARCIPAVRALCVAVFVLALLNGIWLSIHDRVVTTEWLRMVQPGESSLLDFARGSVSTARRLHSIVAWVLGGLMLAACASVVLFRGWRALLQERLLLGIGVLVLAFAATGHGLDPARSGPDDESRPPDQAFLVRLHAVWLLSGALLVLVIAAGGAFTRNMSGVRLAGGAGELPGVLARLMGRLFCVVACFNLLDSVGEILAYRFWVRDFKDGILILVSGWTLAAWFPLVAAAVWIVPLWGMVRLLASRPRAFCAAIVVFLWILQAAFIYLYYLRALSEAIGALRVSDLAWITVLTGSTLLLVPVSHILALLLKAEKRVPVSIDRALRCVARAYLLLPLYPLLWIRRTRTPLLLGETRPVRLIETGLVVVVAGMLYYVLIEHFNRMSFLFHTSTLACLLTVLVLGTLSRPGAVPRSAWIPAVVLLLALGANLVPALGQNARFLVVRKIKSTANERRLLSPLLFDGEIAEARMSAESVRSPGDAGGEATSPTRLPISDRLPNIVLLIPDGLRWDSLGMNGSPRRVSPNLDELAGQSFVFDRVYAQSVLTEPSMRILYTGRYQSRHFDRSMTGRHLLEYLRDRGYRHFVDTRRHFYTRFELDGVDHRPLLREDDHGDGARKVDRAIEYAESIPRETPFFMMIFFMETHFHHEYHPEAPDFGRDLRGLYDNCIAYVDAQIGRLLRYLERSGKLADTIVILTSDHGCEFREHGMEFHTLQLYEESLRVPLLIHLPPALRLSPPARVRRPVGLIDVTPTLCDLLGLDVRGFEGRSFARALVDPSFRDADGESRDLFFLSGFEDQFGLLHDFRTKFIYNRRERFFELYDLVSDPGETRNRVDAEPRQAREMFGRMRGFLGSGSGRFEAESIFGKR